MTLIKGKHTGGGLFAGGGGGGEHSSVCGGGGATLAAWVRERSQNTHLGSKKHQYYILSRTASRDSK